MPGRGREHRSRKSHSWPEHAGDGDRDVGQNISDVATLTGLVNPTGAGEVTFDLYKGEDCSGQSWKRLGATPASVSAKTANYTSDEFDTTSLRRRHLPLDRPLLRRRQQQRRSDGECLEEDENTDVEKPTPGLATKATASAVVGEKISDVATLTGLVNPPAPAK